MSVEFEPVKLGPPRRRVDPVAIGALLVAVGLVAAVIKPWNDAPLTGRVALEADGAAPSPVAAIPATARPSTPAALPQILQPVSTASFATWDQVRPALRPHTVWGIRAIVGRPSGLLASAGDLRYEETWSEVPAAGRGLPTVDIEPNDRTVVAIGITFPPAHTPIDTRIWLVHPDRLEWIDTQPLDPSPAGGGFLYRVVGPDGAFQNWAAGRYRIDVLVDGGVRRFGFTLPNRFEIVPDGAEPPTLPAGIVAPAGALPDLPIGPFMTAAGVSIPLRADAGPPLTEVGAWLDVDPGTNEPPRSHVATVFGPTATGLGVILPAGSVVRASSLVRLAPEPLPEAPVRVGDRPTADRPQAPNVLFRADGGGAWAPGVYRISVSWDDPTGRHAESWHVELQPGPARTPSAMLVAARRLARFAGQTGVAAGAAEPLEGGPRWVTIRLLRAGQASRTGIPPRDRVPCDGVRIDGLSGVLGLAGPVDDPPPKVTARVLFEFNRSDEQPLLTAAGDVPGLTLVAPAAEPPRPSAAYQLRVDDTANPPGASICLSLSPAG